MVDVNWAVDASPHPAANLYQGRADVEQDNLPEVTELTGEGWWLAPDPPMWVFLPAIWPVHERTWVPDRSTHYLTRWSDNGYSDRVPWSDRDHAEVEVDMNELLGQAGLPERPAGRVWLLRIPTRFTTLQAVLHDLVSSAEANGIIPSCNSDFVAHAARRLQTLFDDV